MLYLLYSLTAFIGSFLLFSIQPMAARELLPVYGGSAMVWGSTMFFFQIMVLGGYLWAHGIMRCRHRKAADLLHCGLLLLPWVILPFAGRDAEAVTAQWPAWGVMSHLGARLGASVLILCTVAVTLQNWLTRYNHTHRFDPYKLYAFSNAGSLIALLSYPIAVEPWFTLSAQRAAWWGLLGIMTVMNLSCCPSLLELFGHRQSPLLETAQQEINQRPAAPVTRQQWWSWILLSAAPCALMVAITHHISRNLAAVPFLWIAPLAVYLCSFIIAFRRKPPQDSRLFTLVPWLAMTGFLLYGIELFRQTLPAIALLLIALAAQAGLCLACTVRLSTTRPANDQHLSLYYLAIAIGGCIGGAAAGWIPPLVTNSTVEFPLSIALVLFALGLAAERSASVPASCDTTCKRPKSEYTKAVLALSGMLVAWLIIPALAGRLIADWQAYSGMVFIFSAAVFSLSLLAWRNSQRMLALLLLVASIASIHTEPLFTGAGVRLRGRNYYGVYRVFDRDGMRYLQHEGTLHGRESLDPARRGIPMGYYHAIAPAGEIMLDPPIKVMNIGMIGLGTGALAAHLSRSQTMHILEIDPDGPEVAGHYFSFLERARNNEASIVIHTGDGRRILRDTFSDHSLDLLILDAFSGGAIPVHLLTREAFLEYARVLTPDGILIAHISNRYLKLAPVVAVNAKEAGFKAAVKTVSGIQSPDVDACEWIVFTSNDTTYNKLLSKHHWQAEPATSHRPWTDDFSNLLRALW